jgi:hemerythrin-like domain-containing protein
MREHDARRAFLAASGAGFLLAACGRAGQAQASPPAASPGAAAAAGKGEDVGAVEDLMREHGVIRRVLVIYREVASRLRTKPAEVPPDALQKAATLMRSFGEDYHEKQLEEANIFPALKAAGSRVAVVETLTAQHRRGREITEYVLSSARRSIGPQAAGPLARTLDAFARMYEEHTSIEDTIIFPAWKKLFTPQQLDEIGDRFEDIEHRTFGKDGFDDAVDQVGAIEKALGIELAALTAPPPI